MLDMGPTIHQDNIFLHDIASILGILELGRDVNMMTLFIIIFSFSYSSQAPRPQVKCK